MKRCNRCKQEKPLTEFHRCSSARDGLQRHCKSCNRDMARVYNQKPKRLAYRKAWQKGKRYGLPHRLIEPLIEKLLEKQQNLCPICDEPFSEERPPCIDHNHATGQIRGLLHQPCNLALGGFNESIDRLQNAINYLLGR